MPLALRVILSMILVAATMYCCYGFVAIGEVEPPSANSYRLLYGTGVLASIAAIAAVWLVKRKK
jgi:hypothetical protein